MVDPYQVLLGLTVAIWINGLWLIKVIIWKPKRFSGAQVLKAKAEPKVESLSDLGYRDPWEREVH